MIETLPGPPRPRGGRRTLPTGTNPYAPAPARVLRIRSLTSDVRLFELAFAEPELAGRFTFRPGQFVMLSVLGVGEAPFSLPSSPLRPGSFQLGIRRVGTLTGYLFDHVRDGAIVGVRGPLGNGYPLESFVDRDLLLVAGGLGMVPLRGLLQYVLDDRARFGRLIVLYGTGSPERLLFRDELETLARRDDVEVRLIVDRGDGARWTGRTGRVTELIDDVALDVPRTTAVACGPPAFYRFVIERLLERGFSKDRVFVNLERRMDCGIGKCGHCAVGYTFTCLHGPVFSLWDATNLPELIHP